MTRLNTDKNRKAIQTKIDMFYPAFPKRIPFRDYTFVEPDLRVKFPVLRCCNGRHFLGETGSKVDSTNSADNKLLGKTANDNNFANSSKIHTLAPIASVTPPPEIEILMPISTTKVKSASNDDNNNENIMNSIPSKQTSFSFISRYKDTINHTNNGNYNNNSNNNVITLSPNKQTSFSFIPHYKNKEYNNKENEVELIDLAMPIKLEPYPMGDALAEHQAMDDFILTEPVNKDSNLAYLRQNITMDVIGKSLPNFRKLMENFRELYPNGTGLIYCMSKNECETVADVAGTDALPYHMDLPELIREETQRRWMQNDIRILCATNAFGKSVIKQDVRFIIHYTLPQSLTIYEQQCEMAGMDGQLSHCVLLYSFNDHLRVWRLIESDIHKPPPNVLISKEQALRDVLRYGENIAVCRRKWLANYFGEEFTEKQCINTPCPCTICCFMHERNGQPIPLYDFTDQALAIFSSVIAMRNVGVIYVADLFRGLMTKKRVKNQVDNSNDARLPLFGLGQGLADADCRRFIQKLVIDEYMRLRTMTTRHGTVIGYLYLAKKGWTMMKNYKQKPDAVPPSERIYMHVLEHHKNEKRRSSSNRDSTGADRETPGSNKRIRRGTNYIDVEDIIDYDLEEEPEDADEWGDLY